MEFIKEKLNKIKESLKEAGQPITGRLFDNGTVIKYGFWDDVKQYDTSGAAADDRRVTKDTPLVAVKLADGSTAVYVQKETHENVKGSFKEVSKEKVFAEMEKRGFKSWVTHDGDWAFEKRGTIYAFNCSILCNPDTMENLRMVFDRGAVIKEENVAESKSILDSYYDAFAFLQRIK